MINNISFRKIAYILNNPSDLSKDDIFFILKNKRRRAVIKIINKENEAYFEDIVYRIALDENDKESNQLTSDERKRVYIALYQNHMTPLEKYNILNSKRNHDGMIYIKNNNTEMLAFIISIIDIIVN